MSHVRREAEANSEAFDLFPLIRAAIVHSQTKIKYFKKTVYLNCIICERLLAGIGIRTKQEAMNEWGKAKMA